MRKKGIKGKRPPLYAGCSTMLTRAPYASPDCQAGDELCAFIWPEPVEDAWRLSWEAE
jgi:hypothetical protein